MVEQKVPVGWEEVYDKSVGTLVRECLTILEGLISNEQQRQAIRLLLRKAIYTSTDKLKEDLVRMGLEKRQEEFNFPKGNI